MNGTHNMQENITYTWNDVREMINDCVAILPNSDNHSYELIIAVVRGGLVPATMISHKIGLPVECITYSSRDIKKTTDRASAQLTDIFAAQQRRQFNVLVVDDIADTGNTFTIIEQLIKDVAFQTGKVVSVDTLSLVTRDSLENKPTFYSVIVEGDEWVDFPWEVD